MPTVVVCTRDRRASVLETLRSLAVQDTRHFRLLVVDNGSSDGTAEAVVAAAAADGLSVEVLVEPNAGLSAARNCALARASGPWVAFLDDDVTAAPGLVAAYTAAFQDPSVIAAGGRIVPALPEDVDPFVARHSQRPYGGPCAAYDLGDSPRSVGDGLPPPFGGNMAVRLAELQALSGFRTDLGWGPSGIPGEETELFQRLLERGGKVVYVPGARVEHRVQREKLTREYFLDWYYRQGRASARITRSARTPLRCALQTGEQVLKVVRYGVSRFTAGDPQRRFDVACKLARAKGKFAGLVQVT